MLPAFSEALAQTPTKLTLQPGLSEQCTPQPAGAVALLRTPPSLVTSVAATPAESPRSPVGAQRAHSGSPCTDTVSYRVRNTFIDFRPPRSPSMMALARSEPRNLRPLASHPTSRTGSPTRQSASLPASSQAMTPVGELRETWPRTPSTNGRTTEERRVETGSLAPGATVEVVDTLIYRYAEDPQLNYELPAGLVGVVVAVDADGDATVDWGEPIGRKWLMRADLAKVRVHPRVVDVVEPSSFTSFAPTQFFVTTYYQPQPPAPVAWWAASAPTGVTLPAQTLAAQPLPPAQPQPPGISLPLFEYLSPPRQAGARVPLPLSEYLSPPRAEYLPSSLVQPRRLF